MTEGIVDILKGCLCDLPIIDRCAGLSTIKSVKDKKLPFENCAEQTACNVDTSLAPNKKYKSILYFQERGGNKLVKKMPCMSEYETRLRVYVWLNHKDFGYNECIKSRAIDAVVSSLCDYKCYAEKENESPYCGLRIEDLTTVVTNVFGDYDYKGICADRLFCDPYEFFAIDFTVKYFYNSSCLEPLTINTPLEC